MREIKFRAWDKEKKKMLYGGFCVIPTSPSWGATKYFVPKEFDKVEWFDCAVFDWADAYLIMGNYELTQYTGLKDKNGKEIYEGDIIGIIKPVEEGMCWEVLWHKNGWHLKLHGHSSIKEYVIPIFIGGFDEIIGNIYENPELLGS